MVSRITDSHYGGGVLCKEYLLNVTYMLLYPIIIIILPSQAYARTYLHYTTPNKTTSPPHPD